MKVVRSKKLARKRKGTDFIERFADRGKRTFSRQSAAGERSHTNDGPDWRAYHVHADREAFIILQGNGVMVVDDKRHEVRTGDIIIIEPSEDHHLCSSMEEPIVVLWCNAGPERHPDQHTVNDNI